MLCYYAHLAQCYTWSGARLDQGVSLNTVIYRVSSDLRCLTLSACSRRRSAQCVCINPNGELQRESSATPHWVVVSSCALCVLSIWPDQLKMLPLGLSILGSTNNYGGSTADRELLLFVLNFVLIYENLLVKISAMKK